MLRHVGGRTAVVNTSHANVTDASVPFINYSLPIGIPYFSWFFFFYNVAETDL